METVHEDDNPEKRMISIIESDILDFTNNSPPVDGEDIMMEFGIHPGPEVGDMLRRARDLYRSGIRDKEQILEKLRDQID